MIHFTQGFWSVFVFWFVTISVIGTIGFTIVVIIGGLADLKYLFRALAEEQVDETDDGRVIARPQGDAKAHGAKSRTPGAVERSRRAGPGGVPEP